MVVVKSSIPCTEAMDVFVADGIASSIATMTLVRNLDGIRTVGSAVHTLNIVPLISRCFAVARTVGFVPIGSIVGGGTHWMNQMETAFRVALLSPNCWLLTLLDDAIEAGTTNPFLAIIRRSRHCASTTNYDGNNNKITIVVVDQKFQHEFQ